MVAQEQGRTVWLWAFREAKEGWVLGNLKLRISF